MPSISDSRKQVEEQLRTENTAIDHDAVLANLQDEIDKHNGIKEDLRSSMRGHREGQSDGTQRRSSPSGKFRFKGGERKSARRRKHHSRHDKDESRHHRRKRKRDHQTDREADKATHPFPREPIDPTGLGHASEDTAFRDSLFDALADDEGAAYWESIYDQPIHVYARPNVQTEKGELEQMSDEQYTAYVKTKMWEKKHPEAVLERERSERKKREEEEQRTRRREEFVRRKEQARWKRAQRKTFRGGDDDEEDRDDSHSGKRYEYEFAGERPFKAGGPSISHAQKREYEDTWSKYLSAWDRLKLELLDERRSDSSAPEPQAKASRRIPWPVIASKPVIKGNIEDFMRHAPADQERSIAQLLKAERVRWHPDKVQQRFGGEVDEGTMKLVTGVFQVVDGLLEEERRRQGS